MSLTPVPLSSDEIEQLDFFAFLGSDRDMLALIHRCPTCEQPILVCDNGWLDAKPAEDRSSPLAMGVVKLGGLTMMAGGAVGGGSMHIIHDHQPDE
jgi:hypothetical protein